MSVMTTETAKTAELKSKIAAMSFAERAQRASDLANSPDYEANRDEFVKLLFGADAEIAD